MRTIVGRTVDALFFETWCETRGLNRSERRVMRGAVDGFSSIEGLALRFGVKTATLKKQSAGICGKVGTSNLRDAVILVLREALEKERRA